MTLINLTVGSKPLVFFVLKKLINEKRILNELKLNNNTLVTESSKQNFIIYMNNLAFALKQDFDIDIQSVLDNLYEVSDKITPIDIQSVIESIHNIAKSKNYNSELSSSADFTITETSTIREEVNKAIEEAQNEKDFDSKFDDYSKLIDKNGQPVPFVAVRNDIIKYFDEKNPLKSKIIAEIIKGNNSILYTLIKVHSSGILRSEALKNKELNFGSYTYGNNLEAIYLLDFIPRMPERNIGMWDVLFHEFVHAATISHSNKALLSKTDNYLKEVKN